jgi:phage shock protein A
VRERRRTAEPPPSSPERLIERHVEDARRQLAEGREQLKQARRRVVQLEDAVANWERLAGELRAGRRNGSAASR